MSLSLAPTAWAQDCSTPMELPDKPSIGDFADYSDFVARIMDFKKKKRQQIQHKRKCPDAYLPEHQVSSDPTVIEGPETLREAMRRSQRLPEVDYSRHQTWHNRSTSRSFALPRLQEPELAQRSLSSNLRNLVAGASPLTGMDVLPTVYATQLNSAYMSGVSAQEGSESLLTLQNMLEENIIGKFLSATLRELLDAGSLKTTPTVEGNRLVFLVSTEGNEVLTGGELHFEDCLSSCVTD